MNLKFKAEKINIEYAKGQRRPVIKLEGVCRVFFENNLQALMDEFGAEKFLDSMSFDFLRRFESLAKSKGLI